MSLATRCPACGTVFRVVPDQLRVSEGWVRCGRCSEVFNGQAELVDLAIVQPDAAQAPDAPPQAPIEPPESAVATPHDATVAVDVPDIAPGTRDDPPAEAPPAYTLAAPADGRRRQEPPLEADTPPPPDEGLLAATNAPEAEGLGEPAPRFIREVERARRWQRPAVRRTLAGIALLGTLVLALQVAVEYRDLIAARWAAARPALETLCHWTGCRIEPPRWIEAIVVDGSGLVRLDGTDTYRLNVQLRNRAAMDLALPSVDLVLTDAQGRVIARRSLPPGDLGVASPVLPALGELALQASLGVTERAVAGYTIEIFYP